ncbi:unnamed protein product, partial [Brassica rapa subsp. narinosa]
HISACWPFPWTLRVLIRGLIRVLNSYQHADHTYQHAGPSRGLSVRSERCFHRTDLANDTCLWEPKLLLRVGNRAAGACVASSPDSDLEAFSHNPAHGSFAPLAFQPSAMTNCANQRLNYYCDAGISRVKLTCLTTV